ncbi:MAG: DNA-3-methyladenine glycosylase I [Spirochaetaceae bacterium]|nr:DNA-3-methyladenine glycosylase I [Spirochaetaceae bacterium]
MGEPRRCPWCAGDALMQAYHDGEWGTPVWDDDRLQFEFLTLEGAQAGLSWRTILHKRAGYRRAYHDFAVTRVARFGAAERDALLRNREIVRNRLKIDASIANARAFLAVQEQFGSFSAYLWRFVDGAPVVGGWRGEDEVPAQTELSQRVSRDLKRRGFRFVGPTIVYSHLQAVGLVNDHLRDCFRFRELAAAAGNRPASHPGAPAGPSPSTARSDADRRSAAPHERARISTNKRNT